MCAICCNLDSQITPSTEDLQASTNLNGLLRGIEDKAVVNHCGFESYKTKQVKSVQFSSILFNIHKLHNKFTKVVYTNTIHFGEN